MEKENLYFIAIIPPQEICDEITAFKLDFSDHFESKTALKVMPHITLKAPFKLNAIHHLDLKDWFQKLPVAFCPFQIELKNFGAFHNKNHPVVFVHPILNAPLVALQKKIIDGFRLAYPKIEVTNTELKFTPHITIAYRDLGFDNFIAAWEIYKKKEYAAAFDVSSFHLLQHNGKIWNVIDTYSIK